MKKRGIGVGSMFYGVGNTGLPNPSGAFVEIHGDGTVNLLVGCADIGQGSDTTMAQIVAEEIGVKLEAVIVTSADTAVTPEGGATSASRQTYISGNASLLAAKEAKKVLYEETAAFFGVEPEKLYGKSGTIYVEGDESQSISVGEAVGKCRAKGKLTMGHGWFNPDTTGLDAETGQGKPYGAYAYATQIAEVEVDTETGQVSVLKIIAAHDVGKAVNPKNVEGQIEGGCITGLGLALMEDIKTEKGIIQTPSFATYLIPTALDVPEIIPVIVEEPDNSGPFGAKGVGEPALIPTSAAIANAIYNAVGIRVTQLPITSEYILEKLKEK